MENDIFLIPHNDNYILYAPLKGIISLINSVAAEEIRRKIIENVTEKFSEKQIGKSRILFKHEHINNLTFILTSDCTMNCIYCYANGGENRKVLAWETFVGIFENVLRGIINHEEKSQLNISFHGGDITSVWHLFRDSVNHIKEKCDYYGVKFRISVGINGVLNNVQREWIIRNTNSATVSLDGYAEIQDYHRPLKLNRESFRFVDQTLKHFDARSYNYGIRSTITSKSVDKLEKIVEYFCNNYSVKKIMVEPMFPMGRGINVDPPSNEDFAVNFKKAKKIAKRFKKELSYSGARLGTTTDIFCKALDNSVVITPDGLVSCCYEVITNDDPVSEYFVHGYFDQVLNEFVIDKNKRSKLFDMVNKEKLKCENCFCKYHCAGDCPVKSIYFEVNGENKYYDRCNLNRELTKNQLLEALGYDD